MVLALGQFLVQYSAQLSVPICNNYAVECFVDHPVETTVAMNIWRLALGLALQFTATPWVWLSLPPSMLILEFARRAGWRTCSIRPVE